MVRHWPVLDVNPGRRPTPIGSDGIDPWLRVEEWQAALIIAMLENRGIPHRVRRDGCREMPAGTVPMDRISFPGGDPHRLQSIFESWIPNID
jgi:hypothetical protein